MITVSTTEIQNNFGKFLAAVQAGNELIILKNGREVARMVSTEKSISFLSDSLVGVLKNDYSDKDLRDERMSRYESIN